MVLTFKPNVSVTRAAELESRPKSQLESQLQSQLESLREKVLSLLSTSPLSKSGLAAKLGQKQPSGQLHKVIRELLEEGAIAYSIPARPQCRLQKYVCRAHSLPHSEVMVIIGSSLKARSEVANG